MGVGVAMKATLDPAPWTSRPWGCECGAGLHAGEPHEAALACEAVEASATCDCGGYFVDGEVIHDGSCPCAGARR